MNVSMGVETAVEFYINSLVKWLDENSGADCDTDFDSDGDVGYIDVSFGESDPISVIKACLLLLAFSGEMEIMIDGDDLDDISDISDFQASEFYRAILKLFKDDDKPDTKFKEIYLSLKNVKDMEGQPIEFIEYDDFYDSVFHGQTLKTFVALLEDMEDTNESLNKKSRIKESKSPLGIKLLPRYK